MVARTSPVSSIKRSQDKTHRGWLENFQTTQPTQIRQYLVGKQNFAKNHCKFVYSALAGFKMGTPRSALSPIPHLSLYLPSYAATAWYHKVLKDRPDTFESFIDEARAIAKGE
jgi:hypothetical protein